METLRLSREHLSVATNPRTGNALEYAVIGDGTASDELIVMFNGTGGIFPDWPVQMITNSTYSPKIAVTPVYNREDRRRRARRAAAASQVGTRAGLYRS